MSACHRLDSALRTLRQLHPASMGGMLNVVLSAILPAAPLDRAFPLDLSDTLYLVARKRENA